MNDKEDGMTNEVEKIEMPAPIEKAPWEKPARRVQTHAVLSLALLQEAYDKLEKEHEYQAKVLRDQTETLNLQRTRIVSLDQQLADSWIQVQELKGRLASSEQLSKLRLEGLQNQQRRFARTVAKLKKKGAKR